MEAAVKILTDMNTNKRGLIKINKVFIYALFFFCIYSCRQAETSSSATALKFLQGKIGVVRKSVRLIDYQSQTKNFEAVTWAVFDLSSDDWESYRADLNLRSFKPSGDPFGLVSARSDLETGFEGYLDDQFEIYNVKSSNSTCKLFVRGLNYGMLRVVCLDRDF